MQANLVIRLAPPTKFRIVGRIFCSLTRKRKDWRGAIRIDPKDHLPKVLRALVRAPITSSSKTSNGHCLTFLLFIVEFFFILRRKLARKLLEGVTWLPRSRT